MVSAGWNQRLGDLKVSFAKSSQLVETKSSDVVYDQTRYLLPVSENLIDTFTIHYTHLKLPLTTLTYIDGMLLTTNMFGITFASSEDFKQKL